MAMSVQTIRLARAKLAGVLGFRWNHISALPSPSDGITDRNFASPPLVLPEHSGCHRGFGIELPSFAFGASMELMAVPKRKTSPHRRGIRNGPKALKPTPVIIRCRSCGKVKLPHFYCCSGDRGDAADHNDSTR